MFRKVIVGIHTDDFSLYHDLIDTLDSRGIGYRSIDNPKHIPDDVGVIITTTPEIFSSIPTVHPCDYGYIPYTNVRRSVVNAIIDGAILAMTNRNGDIIIGIDPGKRIGLVITSSGMVLESSVHTSIKGVVDYISDMVTIFSDKRITVRIGNGSPIHRDILANRLMDLNTRIEFVDEKSTSGGRHGGHEEAAYRIAMKKGRHFQRKREVFYTRGDIKFIQKESRILSGGMITISQEMAERVARGDITLEEAIREYLD